MGVNMLKTEGKRLHRELENFSEFNEMASFARGNLSDDNEYKTQTTLKN